LQVFIFYFFQALAVRNLIESKYFTELASVELPTADSSGDQQQQHEEPQQQQQQQDADSPPAKVEPKCLPWYPDRMAWQLNLTRRFEKSFLKIFFVV